MMLSMENKPWLQGFPSGGSEECWYYWQKWGDKRSNVPGGREILQCTQRKMVLLLGKLASNTCRQSSLILGVTSLRSYLGSFLTCQHMIRTLLVWVTQDNLCRNVMTAQPSWDTETAPASRLTASYTVQVFQWFLRASVKFRCLSVIPPKRLKVSLLAEERSHLFTSWISGSTLLKNKQALLFPDFLYSENVLSHLFLSQFCLSNITDHFLSSKNNVVLLYYPPNPHLYSSSYSHPRTSLVALAMKNHLQCRRRRFDPWIRKIPWRREMETHSSIPAWELPWREEPGGL